MGRSRRPASVYKWNGAVLDAYLPTAIATLSGMESLSVFSGSWVPVHDIILRQFRSNRIHAHATHLKS